MTDMFIINLLFLTLGSTCISAKKGYTAGYFGFEKIQQNIIIGNEGIDYLLSQAP